MTNNILHQHHTTLPIFIQLLSISHYLNHITSYLNPFSTSHTKQNDPPKYKSHGSFPTTSFNDSVEWNGRFIKRQR